MPFLQDSVDNVDDSVFSPEVGLGDVDVFPEPAGDGHVVGVLVDLDGHVFLGHGGPQARTEGEVLTEDLAAAQGEDVTGEEDGERLGVVIHFKHIVPVDLKGKKYILH